MSPALTDRDQDVLLRWRVFETNSDNLDWFDSGVDRSTPLEDA